MTQKNTKWLMILTNRKKTEKSRKYEYLTYIV